MVKVYLDEYKGWKDCVYITNGIIEAVVTTEVGPRVMRYGFVGKENIMQNDESLLGTSGQEEWVNYGGHRLWHSPELAVRSYVPDNSPIDYELIDNGVSTIQYEDSIGIEKRMQITMEDNGEMTIKHTVINRNYWEIECAAWALSVLCPGGMEAIPVVRGDYDQLLSDRSLTLWPYTIMADSRVYWGNDVITVKQDTNATRKFKFGMQNTAGVVGYFVHNQLFVKKHTHDNDAYYPDGNCSFETFTNSDMLEMESLSPMYQLAHDEAVEHEEKWSLFDGVECPDSKDEKTILQLLEKYSK